jgi:NAD(P)-dependent dehydrogenase (short-subunit alcohol dehydrogenase family)
MAIEFGPRIRVNSICPGAVEGPRQNQVLQKVAEQRGVPLEEIIKEKKAESPLNTFVPPAAIGDAVVFLCSDEGLYLSGTNLNISAGLVLG